MVGDPSFPFDPGGWGTHRRRHPHAHDTPATQNPPPASKTDLIGTIGSNFIKSITGQISAQTTGGKTMTATKPPPTSETKIKAIDSTILFDSDVAFARARWLVDLLKTVCTNVISSVTKYACHLINSDADPMTKDKIEAIVSDSNALGSSFVALRYFLEVGAGVSEDSIIGLTNDLSNVICLRAAINLQKQMEPPKQSRPSMDVTIGTINSTNLQRLIAKYAESSCLAMAAKSTEICHMKLSYYAVADKITLAPVAV
jgi:hypothetical protein